MITRKATTGDVAGVKSPGSGKSVDAAWLRGQGVGRRASSEDNFRSFFNTIGDIVIIGDADGNVIFANDSACGKLGYTLDEIRAKHILELHPASLRAEAGKILDAMFHGERDSCPLQLAAKSGAIIPVETRIWFGEWDGKPSIFGVSKDLSAEQAALQKFERLFRSNPAAMAITGRDDGRFLDVNDAFLGIFGYAKTDVIGRTGGDLGLFVDDERWQEARSDLLGGGCLRNRELVMRRKDGSLIHGLFSGDIIKSQGRDYFLTVMIDISAQVELRRELQAEQTRLENVINSTRLGTWEWNVQTGETTFNDRWAEIVGYTLGELKPVSIATWLDLTHPDDREESERALERHFSGQSEYYEQEVRMRHKDGHWVWILDRGRVVERDGSGKALMMYGTHMDITDKKAMEGRIRELAIRDPLTSLYNRRLYQAKEAGRSRCVWK